LRGFPIPKNEAERVERLRRFQILDSLPDEAYDRIVRMAAEITGTPVSFISLIEEERQWFKAVRGIDLTEGRREFAFCAHTICQDDVLVVEDATQDERFSDSPYVTAKDGVRFYAGTPLRTECGHNVGTLCVVDAKPRAIEDSERQMLRDLAAVVVDLLGLHEHVQRAQRAELRLRDAVDALPSGFSLYDREDRLVLCNDAYRNIYPSMAPHIVEGARFEDMLRKGVEERQFPDAIGDEEAWIQKKLKAHNSPGEVIEQQMADNRWMRIHEQRTREGGVVGYRIDITRLKNQEQELTRLAWTDCLTGSLNRRRFMELAQTEHRRSLRYGRDLSVVLLDVDHFKLINDTYGHSAGDAVLKELVKRWRGEIRNEDLLGRIGGEEFCLVLPETDVPGAMRLAERLRRSTQAGTVSCGADAIVVTISAGVLHCRGGEYSLEDALSGADRALYKAKREGRNRVIRHIDDEQAPLRRLG